MSLADRLAKSLGDSNPVFKEVWEDPERKQQFELSCKLIDIRKKLNMTQQEFARHTGLKQSYLSRLENGEIDMTLGKLESIAQKLGGHIRVDIEFDENEPLIRQ